MTDHKEKVRDEMWKKAAQTYTHFEIDYCDVLEVALDRIVELEDRVKDLELSLLLRDDELRDAREQEEAHRRRVRELEGAINDYVANPGCNAPAKKKAIEKLMSAVMKGIK